MDGEVPSKVKVDVYRTITEKIVAMIEAGAPEFRMPWHRRDAATTRPTNALTGNPYRGVNVLSLWVEATTQGYASATWATYRQWQRLEAHVRKGEHGTLIVFYKRFEEELEGGVGEEDRVIPRMLARASWVFNAAQVDGWPAEMPKGPNRTSKIAVVESLVERSLSEIVHGSTYAYYNRAGDFIGMPNPERFEDTPTRSATEAYYAVLLHELTHWTGAKHRLAREFGKRFGDSAYAMEELVAELGSAFLCADLGIANEPRLDHASYVKSWLDVLKSDRRAIFAAAGRASEAADFLRRFADEV